MNDLVMPQVANEPVVPGLNMDYFWMPFTHNRHFKKHPRLYVAAKGNYLTTYDGRQVYDGTSGLFCCGLGHQHPKIVEAVKSQLDTLDYCAPFQFANDKAFQAAERIAAIAPAGMNRVFFCCSGSEAADTAIKMAIGYHRARGEASRIRIIGRERGYHGVGLGGTAAGGMTNNRKAFAPLMPTGIDHLPHTHDPKHMAYSRGMPKWGVHLADELERLVTLHDASTIAAVLVEPMAGSFGMLPPPVGYLTRLREICDKHGILLIFDEVITGFGRLGHHFSAARFGVTPDLATFAKGVNNATIPMAGVVVKQSVHDAFMTGPEYAAEFFHGYTYSAHPLAMAAAIATLDVIKEEGVLERVRELEKVLEGAVHALKGEPNVIDIRNLGAAAAVEVGSISGSPGLRGMNIVDECFRNGIGIRWNGDSIMMAPPFFSTPDEVARMIETLGAALRANA